MTARKYCSERQTSTTVSLNRRLVTALRTLLREPAISGRSDQLSRPFPGRSHFAVDLTFTHSRTNTALPFTRHIKLLSHSVFFHVAPTALVMAEMIFQGTRISRDFRSLRTRPFEPRRLFIASPALPPQVQAAASRLPYRIHSASATPRHH